MSTLNREIMKRFAEVRSQYGTQEKLAEAVGVSPKIISDYENCRRNPSFNTFIKMCIEMNASIDYIVYGNRIEK